jgi:hypothetical protein
MNWNEKIEDDCKGGRHQSRMGIIRKMGELTKQKRRLNVDASEFSFNWAY